MDVPSFLNWIETHPTIVDLLKWIVLLLLAWVSGAFRFLRSAAKRPEVGVVVPTSRCLLEEIAEYAGKKDCTRAAFLIDASVVNPTNEKIVVQNFGLSYLTLRRWLPRSLRLHPVTLPDRPRLEMGGGMKIMKVWFSRFFDGLEELTIPPGVDAREASNAYLLFVSFTYGNWNPQVDGGRVRVRLSARLTTGERLKREAWVQVTRDRERFEEWVPGILSLIADESSWNVPSP